MQNYLHSLDEKIIPKTLGDMVQLTQALGQNVKMDTPVYSHNFLLNLTLFLCSAGRNCYRIQWDVLLKEGFQL